MPYLGPIRGDIGRELLARILREAHIARDEYSGGATLLLGAQFILPHTTGLCWRRSAAYI